MSRRRRVRSWPTPRQEVYVRQGKRCGTCNEVIQPEAPFARGATGLLWLTCFRCRVKGAAKAAATRDGVQANLDRLDFPPLLRLRLRIGRTRPSEVTDVDRAALVEQDWDHFRSPQHALWVAQDGRCSFHGADVAHSDRFVLDHAHDAAGLVRAWLCASCNVAEGKSGRSLGAHLPTFRAQPPAQRVVAMQGLTYDYVKYGRG